MTTPIVLDTDIGDDVDDVLALALAVGSPDEIELVAVTTVMGNVEARSRQARTLLAAASGAHPSRPVSAGCGAPIASRPLWHAKNYLDGALPGQDVVSLPEDALPPPDPRHAVDLLCDMLSADRGVVPVMVGAVTNLAVALAKDYRIASSIPRVVCMAGEFRRPMAEYNVRCDPEALAVVLNSGVKIDFTPFSIGIDTAMTQHDLDRLAAGGGPVSRLLMRSIEAWRGAADRPAFPSLFDPMAVAGIIDESLFEWRRGRVRVELRGSQTYGYTSFERDDEGPHRVAWSCDRARCMSLFLERVEVL